MTTNFKYHPMQDRHPLLENISVRLFNLLQNLHSEGIIDVRDPKTFEGKWESMLKKRGVGRKTLNELEDVLSSRGMAECPDDPSVNFPIQEWILKNGKYVFHKDLK